MKSIRCPDCRVPMTFDETIATLVDCPKCGKTFRFASKSVPGPKPAETISAKLNQKTGSSLQPIKEKKERSKSSAWQRRTDGDDRENRRQRKRKKPTTSPLLWGGIAAACVVVVGGISLLIWSLSSRRTTVQTQPDRPLPVAAKMDQAAADADRVSMQSGADSTPIKSTKSLAEARKGFKTKLARNHSAGNPAPTPPAKIFKLIKYDSPLGKMSAYLTPDPNDGKKRPAIIWITGGDCNTIDDLWSPAPPDNDQTAAQFRKAGIIMMFPSLRGGNDNPGFHEGFFGEADDVLAAAEYLAKQPYVDPARIYLGGHSTGGTMALIVAEMSDRFRAVFSFGPANDVRGYPDEFTPFDVNNSRESELRSPGFWLGSIKSPTFVIEGDSPQANISALRSMQQESTNSKVVFLPVRGASHFDLLAPCNRLIAEKILRDEGPTCQIRLTQDELNRVAGR